VVYVNDAAKHMFGRGRSGHREAVYQVVRDYDLNDLLSRRGVVSAACVVAYGRAAMAPGDGGLIDDAGTGCTTFHDPPRCGGSK
jgi:hypothetical protein